MPFTGIVDIKANKNSDTPSKVGVEERNVANVRTTQIILAVQVELPVPAKLHLFTSVTRWLDDLLNICPLTIMKMSPNNKKITQ